MDAHKDQNSAKEPKPGELAPSRPEAPTVVPRRIIAVTGPSAAPAGLSTTPDAMSLIKALRRRWFLAGALGCLAAVVTAAVAWYALPPKFLATVMLLVSAQWQNGLDRTPNPVDHLRVVRTTADRIKSKDVIIKALNQPGVRKLKMIRKFPDAVSGACLDRGEPQGRIQGKLRGYQHQSQRRGPRRSAAVISALTKSFLDIVTKEDNKQKNDRLQRDERRHVEAREKLREKLAEKEGLVKLNNGKPIQTMLAEQLENRNRLHHALEILGNHQFELDKKNTRLAVIQGSKNKFKDLPDPEFRLKDLYEFEATGKLKQDAETVVSLEKTVDRLRKKGHPEDDAFLKQFVRDLDTAKKSVAKLPRRDPDRAGCEIARET